MSIYIGTSGWSYDHWNNVLYAPDTPQRERLAVYVQRYLTVEVNSTFYRWPPDAAFASWRRRTPSQFQLSVKAPRGLTHGKRLWQPERWIARIARGLLPLGDRLGVVLVQLPPAMEYDYARLEYFLAQVPRHLRVALELRHASWQREDIWALLEQYRAAYCVMSGAGLPCVLRATAPFVYLRLHGPDNVHLYGGSYSERDLGWWAERIGEWAGGGHDVFAYFNNDGDGNAVRNAATLRRLVGA